MTRLGLCPHDGALGEVAKTTWHRVDGIRWMFRAFRCPAGHGWQIDLPAPPGAGPQ